MTQTPPQNKPGPAGPTAFRRVLLKISGEALMGREGECLSRGILDQVAAEIKACRDLGVEMGLVVGGGNIIRGASAKGLDRVKADQMGMLATLINSLALAEALKLQGLSAKVMSAVPVGPFAPVFDRDEALDLLAQGTVVVFGAGTGHPYFTTDTTAALRAVEIKAEAVFKATKVDGVYDSDPEKNPAARRLERLTFDRAIRENLRVMDQTAVAFCRDNRLPVLVFKLEPGRLKQAVQTGRGGSLMADD